jgi:hypothetical protein
MTILIILGWILGIAILGAILFVAFYHLFFWNEDRIANRTTLADKFGKTKDHP